MSESADRVAEILAAWKAQRRGDAGPTLDDLCEEHPQFADELRSRAVLLEALGRHLGREPRPPAAHLPPLRTERYARFRPAGEGGMGIVYWAIDSDLNREVAFKVVRPGSPAPGRSAPAAPMDLSPPAAGTPASAAFATLKARFLQEAWVTAGMSHPGVVPVYELGETAQGVPFYTMRFVRGNRTLAQAVDETRGRPFEERLPLLEPFLKVCDTLSYAHAQGVVHRDVKPENVALGEFGEVVVLDWGLAKIDERDDVGGDAWQDRVREFREAADLRTLASVLGTPGYMSPEAALGRVGEVDARSDVYSLGAILYRILTGRLPFEFSTFAELIKKLMEGTPTAPRELDAGVPDELSRLCLRALAKNRDARPASAEAFAAEVRGWQTRRTVDREADALLRDAQDALESASTLTGAAAAAEIDRAAAIVSQAVGLRPDDAARALAIEVARLRESTMAGRERAARRRTLRRVGTATLAVAAVAAVVVAALLDQARRETAKARDVATLERDAKTAALSRAEAETQAKREALDAETKALRHARSLALVGASTAALQVDGMRALLLAREAVETEPSRDAFNQLRLAVFQSRERAVLRGHRDIVNMATFSAQGDRIATTSHDSTARVWDLAGHEIVALRGHGDEVYTAAFSRKGDRIVTASKDATARVWDLSGKEVAVLRGHGDAVCNAVFSPDGSRVVTASRDATARIWDSSGAQLAVLRGHTGGVRMATFSPAGDRILTASDDATARVWDLAGTELAVMKGHEREVWTAVFSPQGDRVATSSEDATARVWDLEGRQLAVLRGHESLVGIVAFSPQGDRLVTGSWDETARVWDLSGRQLAVLRCLRPITAVVFSPQGDRVVTASYDGTARLWEATGSEQAVLRGHGGFVNSACFSPRGDLILTSSNDATARVWNVDRRESAALTGHRDVVRTASFSADGNRIVTASDDGTARVWDVSGRESAVLRGHEGRVRSAAFSPDASRVVTSSADRTARVWDLAGSESAVLRGHEIPLASAAFSPLGDRVVTMSAGVQSSSRGTDDRSARIWDLAGRLVATLSHPSRVFAVAFSPSGDRVVTASWDGTARVWDVAGNCLAVLTGHQGPVTVAAFSPKGDRVVTGSFDQTARVWDLEGHTLAVLSGSPAGLSTAGFSPLGDRILTASWDGTGRLWDLAGRQTAVLAGHEGEIYTSVFSRAGDRIVTASKDGTARIWDLAGSELAVLRGHGDVVFSAAISPLGDKVVTASADGVALVWLVRDEDVVALARERTTRELDRVERERYADILGAGNARALASYRASDVIDRLARDVVLVSELVERVQSDPTLDDGVRAEALRLAAERTDDPAAINRATWSVVKAPGGAVDAYRLAARRLAVAARLVPDDPDVANSLGVAQYRAGLYADALATLSRSDAMNVKTKPPGIVEDVAFLAMCHQRLGHKDEARECLDRLRVMMKDRKRAEDPDAGAFLKEAEALVGGD